MPTALRWPAPLRPGQRVAVTAPSSGVGKALHARLDLALAHLRALGYVVEEGCCLRDEMNGASAGADERTAELMQFLLRDDIAAVLPPWGGELAIELLDRIDWPALQQVGPKWLIGYSDTSTLLLAFSLRLGWATAHGPCLMDRVPGQDDALTRSALAGLGTPAGAPLTQPQSAAWQRQWTDFASAPGSTYRLTEPTRWRCLDGADAASFDGRLIGGCLDTLAYTAGSPHGDLRRFIADHQGDGVVLYLENAEQSPTAVVRALHRLRWEGWLDGLAGLLVGRNAGPDAASDTELSYAQALQDMLGASAYPVLVDVDIGHLPPQMLIVNGAKAAVRWDRVRGGQIEQQFG